MQIDWTLPIGTVLLFSSQFILGIVAFLRGMQRIERSIDLRFHNFEVTLNTFREGDLRSLKDSVTRLETGQDEWTKSLRERTHDLADKVNDLLLRVDRLERPERYDRRHTDKKHDH